MKLSLVLLFFTLATCTFPQDPENSFEEARRDALLVGVIHNPPYSIIEDSEISGTEIQKVQEFAAQNDLQIRLFPGTESELVDKLEKYELHVLVGGFTKNSIWKKKAGMTATYDDKHVFLIPKGENQLLEELESYILK